MEKLVNRIKIHEIYSRFKALLIFECTQIPGMTKERLGISRDFCLLQGLSMGSTGMIDLLFNFFAVENNLDFERFFSDIFNDTQEQ